MTSSACVIEGLGVAVPPRVVTNDAYAAKLDTSDEWIRTRTGIVQRHVADPPTATSDLAVEAAQRALKSAGSGDVDAVVVATTSPDRLCPGTAPEVAARLELPSVAAFDLNAACSGFVYGLATAAGLIAAQVADRVLLIGSETLTRFMNPTDRTTAVLFGDGAGAVVLRRGQPDEHGAVGPFDLGSDGARADLLAIDAGGSRLPAFARDVPAEAFYLHMDGKEIYRLAVTGMVASSLRVLEQSGWSVDDVDCFIGHQANARILDAVADRLNVPPERRHLNIARYGNTSAASIPLALADAALEPGARVLLTAFGAGLTWGSTVLTWPELTVG